jgi:hypothetical protein
MVMISSSVVTASLASLRKERTYHFPPLPYPPPPLRDKNIEKEHISILLLKSSFQQFRNCYDPGDCRQVHEKIKQSLLFDCCKTSQIILNVVNER